MNYTEYLRGVRALTMEQNVEPLDTASHARLTMDYYQDGINVVRCAQHILTGQDKRESKVPAELLDALYSILNVEGVALRGAENLPYDLDVPYHFEKVRAAIRLATEAGIESL